jgi:hypothetical protein
MNYSTKNYHNLWRTKLLEVIALQLLALPSALSGAPTTAKFYAGASADDGVSFAVSFDVGSAPQLLAEIQVESGHINTVGNLYLVTQQDGQFFLLIDDGSYIEWDGALETLAAAIPAKSLQASELLSVQGDVVLATMGDSSSVITTFLAYDTSAAPGEVYFSGAA